MARPSKRNEQLDAEIAKHLEAGCTIAATAAAVGIHYDTLNEWRKEDPAFDDMVEKALGRARVRLELQLTKAASEDGRLALDMLSRRYPEDWGRKDRLDIRAGTGNADMSPIPKDVADAIAEHALTLMEKQDASEATS